MKRIGFVLKRGKDEAERIASDLIPWLTAAGRECYLSDEHRGLSDRANYVPEARLAESIDLLVVLGGDGTLLHGSALVAERRVPILGINLGHLGFLAPFDPPEARAAVTRALAGDLALEERMRLHVRLYLATGGPVIERFALNDAVVSQGAMARLIALLATLDGKRITVYKADGLIVSTPSGSTAYNLAAGGPIVTPDHEAMALTPICSHALTNRPLVVSAQAVLGLELAGESRSVVLTVDGQWAHPLSPGDRVEISRAATSVRVFRGDKTYFEILEEKLNWGRREGAPRGS
jgi:NAD+ kinase